MQTTLCLSSPFTFFAISFDNDCYNVAIIRARKRKTAISHQSSRHIPSILAHSACVCEVDAIFETRSAVGGCYVWRAWNARNGGRPAHWEAWPDFPMEAVPPKPATICAADGVAPWPGQSQRSQPIGSLRRKMCPCASVDCAET